jgi:hypothetical protein
MANPKSFDPRSEAEKARADLKRNSEMDMALPESPAERVPSVTPDTFGVHDKTARLRAGGLEGLEAGGTVPKRGPPGSESVVETPQVSTGRDRTAPARRAEEDVLSRAKE